MKNKIFIIFIILLSIFTIWIKNTFANQKIEKNNIEEIKNIQINNNLTINLEKLKKELLNKYNTKIDFEWSLDWDTIKKWEIYKKIFKKIWEKNLSLNIYSINKNGKKLIFKKNYKLFIYKNINYLILDTNSIKEKKVNLFIEKAKNEWVLINKIIETKQENIYQKNILNKILKIKNQEKQNYITVWWDKNFIFSIISKLNKEIKNKKSNIKLNLVLISPFNTDVLNSYIRNFISNKKWINKILLLPELSKSQIIENPWNIEKLENTLKNKEYEYVDINKNSKISNLLFISNFINTLSNNWFSNKYIYLIILIPFLFTGLSIFKHLIWLSPIWVIIPIALTLLFFQIWIFASFIILLSLIIINLLLWKITNKYTLLYTPKISFIITINLILIILLLNILFKYNLINTNLSDTLFIILFLIISERLITLILSKEFNEYKYNLLNTILFALISFLVLNIWYIQTIILAYPELILFLIPINFIIWKFTWLRITEYFRFREVIKSIEE